MDRGIIVTIAHPLVGTLYGPSLLAMFQSLSNRGYIVRILVPSSEDTAIKAGDMYVQTFRIKKWFPVVTLIRLYIRFLRSALKERNLVAMLVDYNSLPILIPIKIVRNIKVVMLSGGDRPVGVPGFLGTIRFWQFRLSLMLARYLADSVTAGSPSEADEFSKLGKIPKERIELNIISAVGPNFTEYRIMANRNEVRRRLGLDQLADKSIVLCHGSLEKSRGIEQIFSEFIQAFADREDVVLLLLGEGSAKYSIQRLIRQKGIRNCFVMGPVPYSTVPDIIFASDVGLVLLPDHPWWRYSCPTKLIEFLAMGKPVVASDLPGIRWVARDYPLISYVKSLHAEELRTTITRALGTHSAALDEGKRCIERFTDHEVAKRIDSIITDGTR